MNTNPIISYTKTNIPSLAQTITSPNSDEASIAKALKGFRKLVSIEDDPPIKAILDKNLLQTFVKFLSHPSNPTIIFESAWVLTNLASSNQFDATKLVANSGAVPIFIKLLDHEIPDIREQVAWCLGNIAGVSVRSDERASLVIKECEATNPLLLRTT